MTATAEHAETTPGPSAACPLCDESLTHVLFSDADTRPSVRRCSACGVAFRCSAAAASEPKHDDVDSPAASFGRFEPFAAAFGQRLRRLRARRLSRGIVAGRALDVGCGRGRTLLALKEAGWDVCGAEVDLTLARAAREQGLTVHDGPVEAQRFADGAFDLVTMFRVLEELARPHETLREVHRILRPGGRLIVSVPSFSKLQQRLFGKEWLHVRESRERFFFDDGSLRRLLESAGFAPQDERHFSIEDSPITWLQSAENLALRNENLLYEMLRRRTKPARGSTGKRVAAVSAGLLLGPAAATASVLAAAVGQGDVIEVMATRR